MSTLLCLHSFRTCTHARVNARLQRLDLATKVDFENGRFSTTYLSIGQCKRLAFIQAVLEDLPILMFDEWAADQDPEFREFFYRRLLPELRGAGKTVIAVSHDDRYFDSADRIIHMARGHITRIDQNTGRAAEARHSARVYL